MRSHFTADEESALRDQLSRDEDVLCPRCGGTVEVSPVPRSQDVAYVRNRVVVICPPCNLRVAVDRG